MATQNFAEKDDTCNLRVSYAKIIGAILSGSIVFSFFALNFCLYMGKCCCYRHCKRVKYDESDFDLPGNTE